LIVCLLVSCAVAQQWKVIQRDMEPVLMGISCLDNSTCYMAGGQDGTPPEGGPQVYKSTDAGKTWKWLPHSGFAMMFLDVAAGTKTQGVTAGVGLLDVIAGVENTQDGESFNVTHFLDMDDECQSTMTVQGVPNGYGLAGDFGKANGAAVSFDGGKSFTHYDVGVNTSSRYGDYPSRNTWYITAGTWPEQGTKAERRADRENGLVRINQKLSLRRTTNANGEVKHKFEFDLNYNATKKRNGKYTAAIAKTTDGGKTWKTQFYNEDFYFNAISCPSERVCFAVGEAEGDSDKPGVRIMRTQDGGATWTTVMYNPTPSFSLIAMDMVNEKEGWAGGGQLASPPNFQAHFWKTVDGGNTWNLEKLAYNYITDYSFIGKGFPYKGYATAIDIDTLCSVLVRE